jgi:hypothetical protein
MRVPSWLKSFTESSQLEYDDRMGYKRIEEVIRDPRLAEQARARNPDFIIDDATNGIDLPPVDSEVAQTFLGAARIAVQQMRQDQEPPSAAPQTKL